jgi:hypothetical protein
MTLFDLISNQELTPDQYRDFEHQPVLPVTTPQHYDNGILTNHFTIFPELAYYEDGGAMRLIPGEFVTYDEDGLITSRRRTLSSEHNYGLRTVFNGRSDFYPNYQYVRPYSIEFKNGKPMVY